MIDQARLLRSLLDLVRIDGVSGRERAVASYLEGRLVALGAACHVDRAGDDFGGDSGNVVAHLPGTVEAPAVLLCAHMDTVRPTRGLQLVVTDDLVSSDGTTILGADDRAGIAIILEVLQALVEGRPGHGPVEVLFTVAEESGMHGAKGVDVGALHAAMGFVFDSSAACGSVVVEAPAAAVFRVTVLGRAAHAAVAPEAGVSAIQIASRAVAGLPIGRHGRTGMLNVGAFHGGQATNIVPDEVEVTGETRSPDPDALRRQMALVVSAFERAASEAGGRIEIQWTHKYGGFDLGVGEPVVQAAVRGIEAVGLQAVPVRYPGGSDANVLNERGIPTVNLGIGTSRVHSCEEAMPIASLARGAEIGLAIVCGVAGHRVRATTAAT